MGMCVSHLKQYKLNSAIVIHLIKMILLLKGILPYLYYLLQLETEIIYNLIIKKSLYSLSKFRA